MRTLALWTIGVLLTATVCQAQQGAPKTAPPSSDPLVGFYICAGTNPDDTRYEGVVQIAKFDGTYRILWTLSDNTQVLGVGIVRNGVFAASYYGGAPAVAVYKIDGNRLVGEWTMGGKEGRTYEEVLTKTAHPPVTNPKPRPPAPQVNPPPPAGISGPRV